MKISDIISLSIALYAALVSTILAIIKIRSNSKILKIVLDYYDYYENVYLLFINKSARPITIANISIDLDGDPVPFPFMFEFDGEGLCLPRTINAYSSVEFKLSGPVFNSIITEKAKNVSIKVFDIEGKVYSKYKIRQVNSRIGGIKDWHN